MPKQNKMSPEERELHALINEIRTNTGVALSYKQIYSDVAKILKSKKGNKEDLFIEYYKKLSKQMFDVIAEKRSLASSTGVWLEKYINLNIYSITKTTADAKTIVNLCCDMIKPGYTDNKDNDISPAGLEKIRDWEIAQLQTRNYYQELSKTMLQLTPEVVEAEKEYIYDEFEIDKPLVTAQQIKNKASVNINRYSYDSDFKNPRTLATVQLYAKTDVIRKELGRHGRLWHWYYSKKVAMYKEFLTYADASLKRVGFDAQKHGNEAIDFCKKNTMHTFKVDVSNVKDAYKRLVDVYEAKRIPELTIGRDQFEKAQALDKNAKTEFSNLLKPYADKHGMKHTDFNKVKAYWSNCGAEYDYTRKTEDMYETATTHLLGTVAVMIESAIKNGREVNVPEILKDARIITNLAIAHNTPAYLVDDILKNDEIMYLHKADDENISSTLNYYLRDLSLDKEQIGKYTEEMKTVFDGWRANIEAMQKEDKEIAKSYNPPEPRTFSTDEEAIADSLLNMGYRPPEVDDKGSIVAHERVIETMEKKWFSGDKKHDGAVMEVFLLNAKKLREMSKMAYAKEDEKVGTVPEAKEAWTKAENELNNKYPDYQSKTMDDFEEVRFSLKGIKLDDGKNIDLSEHIDGESLVKNKEVSISN